jgi:hypothetical protein
MGRQAYLTRIALVRPMNIPPFSPIALVFCPSNAVGLPMQTTSPLSSLWLNHHNGVRRS